MNGPTGTISSDGPCQWCGWPNSNGVAVAGDLCREHRLCSWCTALIKDGNACSLCWMIAEMSDTAAEGAG